MAYKDIPYHYLQIYHCVNACIGYAPIGTMQWRDLADNYRPSSFTKYIIFRKGDLSNERIRNF